VRLIVTPAEASPAESQDSVQLINTLAQAQLWLEQLLRGEVASLRMIAKSAGLSERYVSRIMRCAFSPRISSKRFCKDASRLG
jgi:alkylated DNA nucleotide flippase Atl1